MSQQGRLRLQGCGIHAHKYHQCLLAQGCVFCALNWLDPMNTCLGDKGIVLHALIFPG